MFQKFNSASIHIKKLGIAITVYYFFQRLLLKKDALIKLKIPSIKHAVYLRNKSYDTHIFYQVFVREDLAFVKKLAGPFYSIIDAGANIGLSTIYLKNVFPDAVILSIEPSVKNMEVLKKMW